MARDGSPKPLLERTESDRDGINGDYQEPDENAPLLAAGNNTIPRYDGEEQEEQEEHNSVRSVSTASGVPVPKVEGKSWASIAAIIGLSLAFTCIIIGAFVIPASVEQYGKHALVIEPKGMSIDSFTRTGVRARVQADFYLDASRCKNSAMRNVGRLGMYVAHYLESEPTEVKVYLPEYDNMHVGTAKVPKVKASVRNGEVTRLDFVADVKPGKITNLQRITDDFMRGRMGELTMKGMADVPVSCSWLPWIPLGTTKLAPTIVLEGSDVPGIPAHNITKLNIKEIDIHEGPPGDRMRNVTRGLLASATVEVENEIPSEIPLRFTIPPLAFDMLVDGCAETDPHIIVAEAITSPISIEPKNRIAVNAQGLVRKLPDSFTKPCPNTELSPLDIILGDYIQGKNATIYVRGAHRSYPNLGTPQWIADFMKDITVPISVAGKNFDGLVEDFDIKDVHFSMPDPFADPKSPESNPRISGTIMALASLPKEANFNINVSRIRATADVFHKGMKMGVLDLKEWQKAKSKRIDATEEADAMLMVSSKIKDAPLKITDQDVFSDVIEKLLFGKEVTLDVKALVDMEVATVLGALTIRNVPGEGSVPIKAPSNGGGGGGLKDQLGLINPRVFGVDLIDTGATSLILEAKMNFTNPTNYTASVPYFNVLILSNGSVIGSATVQDLEVRKGNNSNAIARILWDPVTLGDKKSPAYARNLLSQYISGWNTTMTFKTHKDSVPGQPALGEALSRFLIEMPMPHLSAGDGEGGNGGGSDRPHFIQQATIHLFSSTAVFGLLSPFTHTVMWMEAINATAFYNHTEVIGTIQYGLPFKIPPGVSESPRLPVDWDPSGVGYQKMKDALNGGLKVAAKAEAKIRLGKWSDTIWFEGDGIGARVRL